MLASACARGASIVALWGGTGGINKALDNDGPRRAPPAPALAPTRVHEAPRLDWLRAW